MKLKHTKVNYLEVDYGDLERFVHKYYPLNNKWSFVASEECGNDSTHSFPIKKEKMGDYELKALERFKAGHHQNFITSIILTDLCNKDLIDEGEYLINVCWQRRIQ